MLDAGLFQSRGQPSELRPTHVGQLSAITITTRTFKDARALGVVSLRERLTSSPSTSDQGCGPIQKFNAKLSSLALDAVTA